MMKPDLWPRGGAPVGILNRTKEDVVGQHIHLIRINSHRIFQDSKCSDEPNLLPSISEELLRVFTVC